MSFLGDLFPALEMNLGLLFYWSLLLCFSNFPFVESIFGFVRIFEENLIWLLSLVWSLLNKLIFCWFLGWFSTLGGWIWSLFSATAVAESAKSHLSFVSSLSQVYFDSHGHYLSVTHELEFGNMKIVVYLLLDFLFFWFSFSDS